MIPKTALRVVELARRTAGTQFLMLALAYAAFALLGKLLAFAPAFASPLWPAAGIAVAGLLVAGLRLWPGIFAGYLLFHLAWYGAEAGFVGALGTGALLAVGSTLQAVLGAWLVRPALEGFARGCEGVVMRGLLLAGPLACLVAPTLGVTVLWALGHLTPQDLQATWVSWWVGDAIGVVLVGPLAVVAMPPMRKVWQGRVRFIAPPLVGAILLLVLGVTWFHQHEEEAAKAPLALQAELAHNALHASHLAVVGAALATGSHFAASVHVSADEFATFASHLRRPGLKSLQWLPRPAHGSERDPGYDAVQYADPPFSHQREARIDVNTDRAVSAALHRARETGRASASAPVRVGESAQAAVLVVVPVQQPGNDPRSASAAQGPGSPMGFVIAVLDPHALASAVFGSVAAKDLAFTLMDVTAGSSADTLVASGKPVRPGALLWQRDVELLDRTWRLQAHTAGAHWLAGGSPTSLMFLLGALLCMFLFSTFVLTAAGRQRTVDLQVAARTADLDVARRKLEAAMGVAQVVDWEFDISGMFTFDDRYYQLLKTTAAREGGYRMPAMTWVREFMHADDTAVVLNEIARAQDPGYEAPAHAIEFRVRRRDGELRYHAARFEIARDAQGHITRVLGTSHDITAEREATLALERLNADLENEVRRRSHALAASEQQLRATFDVAAVGIAHLSDQGLLRANPKFREITGYGEADLPLLKPAMLVHPQERDQELALNAQMMAGEIPSYMQERRYLRKDGSVVWVRVTGSLVRDEAGAPLYRVVIIEDIDEAHRAQQTRLASETRYRDLFERNPMPMWTYDTATLAFTSVNRAAVEHYGYTEEEFLAMTLRDIRPPEDAAWIEAQAARVRSGLVSVSEVRHRKKDGTLITVDIKSHDLIHEGRRGRLVLAHDVTDGRRAQRRLSGQAIVMEAIAAGEPLPAILRMLEQLVEAESPDLRCAIELTDRPEPRAGAHEWPHTCLASQIASDGGKVLGSLVARGREPRAATAAERELVDTLTYTAAIAISKEREREALRDSEAKFRAIYESSPLGIVLVARDGRILATNRKQCELTGRTEAEIVGRTIQALTLPEDVERDMAQLEQVWRGERASYSIEKRAMRSDGSEYWVSVSGSVVRGEDGEAKFGIRVVQDISARIAAVNALRDSEERFRATFELAAMGIAHVGREGRFLRANPRMCQITGYDEAELLQRGPADIALPEDVADGAAKQSQLWRGEITSFQVEKRYVRKDGSLVWISATISAVHDGEGRIAYTLGLVEDISWRRQAAQELQEQQELNRLLLDNIAEGVVACDGDGNLVLFNKTAREWHGADPRAIPSGQWADHYDLFEGDGSTPLAVERIPLMRAFSGERVLNAEMSIARKGGQPRFVLASGAPLLDAAGRKRGAVIVMHDVTESRRASRVAREALTTLDATEDGAFIFDPQTLRFRYVNEGAAQQTGYTREELLCMTPVDIKPEFTEARFREFVEPMIRGELPSVHFTTVHRRKNGRDVPVEINLQYIDPAGEQARFIAVVRDVTERQRAQRRQEAAAVQLKAANAAVERERASLAQRVAERTAELTATNEALARAKDAAEAASRAKSAFLATVSHEIRTPMNGVLGAMELLQRTGLDGARAKLLGTAQGSARSLLGLLNDLLDMAKIEAGRIEVLPAPTSLAGIVEQVVSTHLPNAIAKDITLTSRIDAGTPAWVAADALRVRQILGNLVSNAVKFTSLGGVEILVRAQGMDGGMHRVCFEVRDTGAGIPAEALATLFRPFEQGTAELARQSGGTGLGLAICRGLAERMGGSVNLSSQPGQGTVATLELAFAQVEAQDPGNDAGAGVDAQWVVGFDGPQGLEVLAVDDHPINRQLLAAQLAQLGLKADIAENGAQALEKLRSRRYALVITDCEMPHMDGFELAGHIRHGGEAFAALPIIACTAHALPEVASRCRASGMDEVLTKPIDLAQLSNALRKWWPAESDAAPAAGATPAPVASVAVLDQAHLARVALGDPAFEQKLMAAFARDTQKTLHELAQAVAERDYERCRHLAHRSRGACLSVGAQALAAAFSALERSSTGQNASAEMRDAWRHVQHEHQRLEETLDEAQSEA